MFWIITFPAKIIKFDNCEKLSFFKIFKIFVNNLSTLQLSCLGFHKNWYQKVTAHDFFYKQRSS